jgi:hypothetical protein
MMFALPAIFIRQHRRRRIAATAIVDAVTISTEALLYHKALAQSLFPYSLLPSPRYSKTGCGWGTYIARALDTGRLVAATAALEGAVERDLGQGC